MNANSCLIEFYNNYDEDNRLILKYGTIEFLTTMHYIEKVLVRKWGDRQLNQMSNSPLILTSRFV